MSYTKGAPGWGEQGSVKGVIFNVLEGVVTAHHGADAWDDLLAAAGVDGAFTSLGNYPHETLEALVGAAAARLGMAPQDVIRWVGRHAFKGLADRYPGLVAPHASARTLIQALNSIIHPEVRKVYPGADAPDFDFEGSTEQTLVMIYRSRRRLCSFAAGLIEGAADRFGESARIDHGTCMLAGADRCVFRIQFAPRVPANDTEAA